MEGELSAVVTACDGQLAVQGLGVYTDAHGGQLDGLAQQVIPQKDVAIQGPVVSTSDQATNSQEELKGR